VINHQHSKEVISKVEELITQAEDKVAEITGDLESIVNIHKNLVRIAWGLTRVIWGDLKNAQDGIMTVKSVEEEFKMYQSAFVAVSRLMPVVEVLMYYLEQAGYFAKDYYDEMNEHYFHRE